MSIFHLHGFLKVQHLTKAIFFISSNYGYVQIILYFFLFLEIPDSIPDFISTVIFQSTNITEVIGYKIP